MGPPAARERGKFGPIMVFTKSSPRASPAAHELLRYAVLIFTIFTTVYRKNHGKHN